MACAGFLAISPARAESGRVHQAAEVQRAADYPPIQSDYAAIRALLEVADPMPGIDIDDAASAALIRRVYVPLVRRRASLYHERQAFDARQLVLASRALAPMGITRFTYGLGMFSVSPDEKWVVATSSDARESPGITLIGMTSQVTLRHPPLGRADSRILWDPHSTCFALDHVSTDDSRSVVIYDIDRHRISTIGRDLPGTWAPACFSHDARYLVCDTAESGAVVELDRRTGCHTRLSPIPGRSMVPVGYTLDDQYIVFECRSPSADGTDSLVVLERSSGLYDTVISGLNLDRRQGRRSAFDSSTEIAYGVVWASGDQHLRAWSIRDGTTLRTSIVGPAAIHSNPVTRDGHVIFGYETPCTPWTYCTWRPTGGGLLRTFTPAANDAQPQLCTNPTALSLSYPGRDGMPVPCYLYLPEAANGSTLPFIVYVHGGPTAQYLKYYNPWFHYFLSHGYGVLVPNIRGSSGFGAWYRDLDNGEKRLDAIHDVIAGAQWLVDKGFTRLDRVGLWGQSYGGYAVLLAAMEAPGQFGAIAADCPVTDMELLGKSRSTNPSPEYGDLQDPAFLATISPILRAAELNTPTVIVHGDDDQVVPVEHATTFVARCRELGKPVELLILPEEGHAFRKRHNMHAAFDIKARLFNKHLRDRPATATRAEPQRDADSAEQPVEVAPSVRSGR